MERAANDCWEQYGFFGLSVFGAPDDDLLTLCQSSLAIRRRRQLRTARCGDLRDTGFAVAATFSNPAHYSIMLPSLTVVRFAALRSCFSPPFDNPGFRPDR